jgi:SAM-dependent methyltransferase
MSSSGLKAAGMTRVNPGPTIPFEYVHRYTYASELLRNKRVLDLAARQGYGARILAETAESVIGLDVDSTVVQDAANKYRRDNLKFLVGSPVSVPISPGHTFDAVICFDAIEDATNPQTFFAEIKRLLKPDGLFLISVPNQSSRDNLFGTKAFTPELFHHLLKSRFSHVEPFKQEIWANSIIQPDALSNNGTGRPKGEPQYLLAIASDSPISTIVTSTYADSVITLLREKEKALRALLEMKAYQDETIKRQERQLAERKQTLATLEEAFAWHRSRIDSLEKTRAFLENEIDELRKKVESDRKALEWRHGQTQDLEETITARDKALEWRADQVEELEHRHEVLTREMTTQLNEVKREMTFQLDAAKDALAAIHASAGWRFILTMRGVRNRLLPEGSARYRLYDRIMRLARGK